MDREEALEALQRLYEQKDQLHSDEEGQKWLEQVSALLHRLAPGRAQGFDDLSPYILLPLSVQTMRPIWHKMGTIVQAAIVEAEARAKGEEKPANALPQKRALPTDSSSKEDLAPTFWEQYGKPVTIGVAATVGPCQ